MAHVIGIDIGGTSARIGLVDAATATILAREVVATGFEAEASALMSGFRLAIGRVAAQGQPAALGVGVPGLQDTQGRVIEASNLPHLNGIAIATELARDFGWPSRIDNDLNVLALGEDRYGKYDARRLLVVALGTGIGAAMVVDHALLRPTSGSLGDPGHIIVDAGGARCRCGARGCLETKVSGWSIAEQGGIADPEVQSSVARWLGMGLATFCVLYEPDCIVLGGKISAAAGEPFLQQTEHHWKYLAQPRFNKVPLLLSRLGDDAGILGAAAMAEQHRDSGAKQQQ